MITEDYVSFETAKLLKEKGFDVNTFNKYAGEDGVIEKWYDDYRECMVRFTWDSGTLINPPTNPKSQYIIYGNTISATTLQMAMKWLREVHHITIGITFSLDIITYEIQKDGEVITAISSSRSYEDMVEEAIKLCLENLI